MNTDDLLSSYDEKRNSFINDFFSVMRSSRKHGFQVVCNLDPDSNDPMEYAVKLLAKSCLKLDCSSGIKYERELFKNTNLYKDAEQFIELAISPEMLIENSIDLTLKRKKHFDFRNFLKWGYDFDYIRRPTFIERFFSGRLKMLDSKEFDS